MRISGWSSDVCSSDLVFLHMGTVRLYGHAGSDVQGAYLPRALIESDEARDPLLAGAALMAEQGWMTPAEIADAYGEIGATLARQAEAAIRRPTITTTAGEKMGRAHV